MYLKVISSITLVDMTARIIMYYARRRILFVEFVARMEDTRLPKKCGMFGEMAGGVGCMGGQEQEWMGCSLDNLRAFGINTNQLVTHDTKCDCSYRSHL